MISQNSRDVEKRKQCILILFLFIISIANERVLIDFKENGQRPSFLPDGMTIDADGFLYVATWGGSKVMKINPTYVLLEINESPFRLLST